MELLHCRSIRARGAAEASCMVGQSFATDGRAAGTLEGERDAHNPQPWLALGMGRGLPA